MPDHRIAGRGGLGDERFAIRREPLVDLGEARICASVSGLDSNCGVISDAAPSIVRMTAVKALSSIQRMNSSGVRAITGICLPDELQLERDIAPDVAVHQAEAGDAGRKQADHGRLDPVIGVPAHQLVAEPEQGGDAGL